MLPIEYDEPSLAARELAEVGHIGGVETAFMPTMLSEPGSAQPAAQSASSKSPASPSPIGAR